MKANELMKNELLFVSPESEEWNRMWKKLATDPINWFQSVPSFARNDKTNEVWQYMCTVQTEKGKYLHQFRHRCHPQTRRRELINVPASREFVMSQD